MSNHFRQGGRPPGRDGAPVGRPSHGHGGPHSGNPRDRRGGGSQGGGSVKPLWPPQRILDLLTNQVVHPSYRLDVFCPMKEGRRGFEPLSSKEKVYEDTIAAVRDRRSLALAWHARRASWLARFERKKLARRVVVETQTRVVLWLSSPSATELGFCLHHVYGLPYLPASGLKGLASNALWRQVDADFKKSIPPGNGPGRAPPEVLDLFGEGGDQGHEGRVAFLDGIPLGDAQGKVLLERDVMTPHHAKYYAGKENAPHDCERPNPLLFLCIPPGQTFEIGLVYTRERESGAKGPSHWLQEAEKHLLFGLAEMGLGAKTSSGYGILVPTSSNSQVSQGGSGPYQDSSTSHPSSPGVPAGLREVVATVVSTDRKSAEGQARDDEGREFRFQCSLLSSKLNVYPQDWKTLHGQRLVFVFDGKEIVSVRREEKA